MGCLPVVVTLNLGKGTLKDGCVESYKQVAEDYNKKLQQELKSINSENSDNYGVRILYGDIYRTLLGIIQNYRQMG